ncbi:MAG: hypothetical protein ACJ8GJ_08125 [Vitreoscilla sp.]
MNTRLNTNRRRVTRPVKVRRAQGGTAARGVVVATGIVAALVLQLAGPRLQCHLADLVGAPSAAPVMTPASTPSCGSPSGANPMHPCKVATIVAAAPVI